MEKEKTKNAEVCSSVKDNVALTQTVTRPSAPRGAVILAKTITDYIAKKNRGDAASYNRMVEELLSPDIQLTMVFRWLMALRICVSQIGKDCRSLVKATLQWPWINGDEQLITEFSSYLADLVSAQPSYLNVCLEMLVSHFTKLLLEEQYTSVHHSIIMLCELVPNCPTVLMPVLVDLFPFKSRPASMQESYVRNVLYVSEYVPTMREGILQLVIRQMIKIDVEVPHIVCDEEDGDDHENDKMDDDSRTDDSQHMFHFETDETTEHHLHPTHYSSQWVTADPMADKLDVLMCCMFEYLQQLLICDGALLNKEQALEIFQMLIKIFESTVLTTFQSGHVQFIWFWVVSKEQILLQHFLNALWTKFTNTSIPVVIRQSAVVYLSGLLSRGLFVPLIVVKNWLVTVVGWIHQYISCCSADKMKSEYYLHAPFYSACQAVFYVFIFHHRQLVADTSTGMEFLRQLNLERIILCQLNPLKNCFSSVVELFASITSQLELVFCYTVIRQNRRLLSLLPQSQETTITGAPNSFHLPDSFFPFDPYMLKRSRRQVKPLYRYWQSAADSEQPPTVQAAGLGDSDIDDDHDVMTTPAHSYQSSPGFDTSPGSLSSLSRTQKC